MYSSIIPKSLSSTAILPLVTWPSNINGVLQSFNKSKNASSPVSVTETTILDGASPNKKASSLTSEELTISKPKLLVNELSNNVINKPPSETSCETQRISKN